MDLPVLDRTKLVVWDLDGTFWDGTLSEGGAGFRPDMLEIVRELAAHGIVSSIASNNDLGPARALLERHGAWPYFVFPHIDWEPKPDTIAALLAEVQLRPQNVLFLDDKPRIRAQVVAAIPELLGSAPAEAFSQTFRRWSSGRVPTDPTLKRLDHYRLLERRHRERSAFVAGDPTRQEDFLRASDIRCQLLPVTSDLAPRVHELMERAHQLNFTRRPMSLETLTALLGDERVECRAVRVRDRFGDYGICGFYALSRETQHLEHYLFSCRILQMGVEAALYGRLGRPAVSVAEEQRISLERLRADSQTADWVAFAEAPSPDLPGSRPNRAAEASGRSLRLNLLGTCELQAVAAAVQALAGTAVQQRAQLPFVDTTGRQIGHFGHHAFLDLTLNDDVRRRHRETLAALPWFDPRLVAQDFLGGTEPSVTVISAVRNAQCADYVHRSGDFMVPLDYFRAGGLDATRPESWPAAGQLVRSIHGPCADDFLPWFAERFRFAGPVPAARYLDSLERLWQRLPGSTRLVLINVVDLGPMPAASELAACRSAQHRAVNAALAGFAARHSERVVLLDVNRHLRVPEDLRVSAPADALGPADVDPYHYPRRVHLGLAVELLQVVRRWDLAAISDVALASVLAATRRT